METIDTSRNPAAHIGWREQLSIALIFALAGLLLVPTFWRGLACGHDTLTHFYRIVQLALNVQDGAPFTLWSQHFMRGYGYTIYPFYAPLSYWLTTAIHFLGFDFSPALRIAAWLMLWLAGWGGYNLSRRYFNSPGAFVSGLAYMFAPYLIYNATQRGAFPELLGLALLPWALTAADIAIIRRTPRSIITAVFTLALVMLSHNIIPNFGFIILLGLAFSRSETFKLQSFWQTIKPALAIIGLTLLVTSFFWLPAYAELDFTQTRRADSPFGLWPRFDQHFIRGYALAGIPEEPADPALTNPPISIKIGAGEALLAAIGVLLSIVLKYYRRPWLWMWALITAVSLFLITHTSWIVWVTLPLPDFVQLPTRFFGPASLGIALLAAIPADWLGRQLKQLDWFPNLRAAALIALYSLAAILVVVSGWFWLYPVICAAPQQPTASTVAQATHWDDAGSISRWGGDSTGETLPYWVDQLPPPDAFIPAYEADEPINRLVLPETAVLLDWQTRANGDNYTLQLTEPATLTYRTFYIPYWRAKINGESTPLTPRPGDGLIQLDAPAGTLDLTFTFGLTPLRIVMLIISGLTAVSLLWFGWRSTSLETASLPSPSKRHHGLFASLIVVLWLLLALVNTTNNPIRADRFADGRLQGIDHPAQIPFDSEFAYLGYNGPEQIPADQIIRLTQYWTATDEIGVPYDFRMRIADDDGNVWHIPIGRPYSYAFLPGKPGWQVGSYVRDAYEINMLPGTPPGTYWLEASAFRSDTDISLIPQNTATAANPAWARIGQIELTPGKWGSTAATAQVDTFAPTPMTAVPGLTLLGWTIPDVTWQPGQHATLDLLWQGNQDVLGETAVVDLWLLDESGEQVAQTAVPVGNTVYPLGSGEDTAVVRSKVTWQLPPALESGVHTVWLNAGEQTIELGQWQIDAPERTFTQPDFTQPADFAVDFARLAGYNLSTQHSALSPHSSLPITLFWQATGETTTSYRIFVHLLDQDGNLITQSDAIPAQWTRPTSGWMAGEYIQDRHILTLPAELNADSYRLVVGLYDTATGTRLGETTLTEWTVPDE